MTLIFASIFGSERRDQAKKDGSSGISGVKWT
jgi:hypothetical protein